MNGWSSSKLVRWRTCLAVAVRLAILLVVIRWPAGHSVANGQPAPHRVRLAPRGDNDSGPRWYPRPMETVAGTITQFDADQIAIQMDGEEVPARYASERVVKIDLTVIPADQQQAIEMLQDGNHDAALPALIRAISDHDASSRPPVWRQQWLSMLAAQAAMRSGRGAIALELVDQLDQRPLPAMVLGLLPIDWTGRLGGDRQAMVDAAVERAKSDSLAVKLVAASWLLSAPKYRAAAESALARLAAQTQRERIARLAGQLRWRTKTPPEIESQWRRWESEIERLPMTLQSGPMISLLHRVRRAGLKDATRKWEMMVDLASPTWHPDLD